MMSAETVMVMMMLMMLMMLGMFIHFTNIVMILVRGLKRRGFSYHD